jgi:AcrR family transcriptional regulator
VKLQEPRTLDDTTAQRLLEAACQVFAEHGRDATVRQIVARAGLKNIAAVNYYFGDKDKLYEAALRHAFRCRLDELQIPSWPAGTHPAAKLRDLIHIIVQRMIIDEVPWHMKLLMREMTEPGEAGRGIVRDFIRPIYELTWKVLRELRPDLDEQKMHLVAFSIAGQCFYHKVARPVIRLVAGEEESAGYTPRRIAEHVADFSLRALGVDPATLPAPAEPTPPGSMS